MKEEKTDIKELGECDNEKTAHLYCFDNELRFILQHEIGSITHEKEESVQIVVKEFQLVK